MPLAADGAADSASHLAAAEPSTTSASKEQIEGLVGKKTLSEQRTCAAIKI